MVVHTPAEPDCCSDNDPLQTVKAQGTSADYNPAEADNQVEFVEVVKVIDHQGN